MPYSAVGGLSARLPANSVAFLACARPGTFLESSSRFGSVEVTPNKLPTTFIFKMRLKIELRQIDTTMVTDGGIGVAP
jgi:hypothetical protein